MDIAISKDRLLADMIKVYCLTLAMGLECDRADLEILWQDLHPKRNAKEARLVISLRIGSQIQPAIHFVNQQTAMQITGKPL